MDHHKSKSSDEINYNILENSLEYILDAVNHLDHENSSSKNIKYGILHFWSGIELLLKKRLMDEHWSLIFKDIKKADKNLLKIGDFESVYFDDLKNRLEKICEINFKKYDGVFEKIRTIRNKIEHFEFKISTQEAQSLVIKAWSFVLDFINENELIIESKKEKKLFKDIKNEMRKCEKFIEQRLKDIYQILEKQKKESPIIVCPHCMQKALPVTGESTSCLFCCQKFDRNNILDQYISVFCPDSKKDLMEILHLCPDCKEESFIQYENDEDDPIWICFSCGNFWPTREIKTCLQCGEYMVSDESYVCNDCTNYNMEKD